MLLKIERLCVERRGQALLDALSLELAAGELLALVGPNGAGKTSLLHAVLGLLRARSGSVTLLGDEVRTLDARARAARVAWLPQHTAPGEALSALEVVAAARFRFNEPFRVAAARALEALERVRIAHVAERSVLALSGGERQRVALAALLAQEAPLLLLDEPANHLDPARQIEVYRLIGELWRDGKGVVCVTHDVNLLRHLGAPAQVRLAGLAERRLQFQTTLADPALPEALGQLFGIQMRALPFEGTRVLVAEPKP